MSKRLWLLPWLILLAGCAELPYYSQSISGHLEVMGKTRPIKDWLADPATDDRLRARLRRVLEMRVFAEQQLALPVEDSYADYADLGRDWVVKNLFAAPEFSLRAKTWCHPLAGCIAYRGYFDEDMLEEDAESLRKQGYDIYIAPIAAYSTLGWFDDPVLNTFVGWSEPGLAGLLFHELAHRRVYVEDDSGFNEAYATAVQQAGVVAWLTHVGDREALARYRQRLDNRRQVFELIRAARVDLQAIYSGTRSQPEKREQKRLRLQRLREDYRRLSAELPGRDGFERWMKSEINNAKLLSVATYHDATPAFHELLQRNRGDFAAFHRAAEAIGELPKPQRSDCLTSLLEPGPARCQGREQAWEPGT